MKVCTRRTGKTKEQHERWMDTVRAVRKVLVPSRKLVNGTQMWVAAEHRYMSSAPSRVYKGTRMIMWEEDTYVQRTSVQTDTTICRKSQWLG